MFKQKIVKTAVAVILALFVCMSFLPACDNESDREQKTAVVYNLNGGIYRSCVLPFTHYYKVDEGESRLIYEPTTLSKQQVTRAGYDFVGWFTGNVSDGEIVFDREWKFDEDKITAAGITLYAKWKKIGTYEYKLCYKDEETGETVELGSYAVSEGDKFIEDYNDFAETRVGYTPIPGFYDENGDVWDSDYRMEGSEDGKRTVQVFVKYVKGSFAMCGTVAQLNAAVRQNRNIYLTADIDFAGAEFGGFGSNGNFTKILYGNGYSVKNFVLKTYYVSKDADIDSRDSYRMSLFGNASGATVENVSFSGVQFVVDAGKSTIQTVVVSPIAIKSDNSVFKNVTFDGTYVIKKLPSGITEDSDEFIVVSGDKAYYKATGKESVTENVTCTLVKQPENN